MKSTWHREFAVTHSKDNPFLHDFYREYFDKTPKRRLHPVSPPRKHLQLEPPCLSATLQRNSSRLPVENTKISKARSKEALWNDRFSVKFSKDNPQYPVAFREYFDSPKVVTKPLKKVNTALNVKRKNTKGKSRASKMSWQLRSTASTERWRSSSPVISLVNSLKHPAKRQYFAAN
jgi:hypothetical protein